MVSSTTLLTATRITHKGVYLRMIRPELLLTVKADALSRGSRTMLLQKQVVFLAERLLTLSERAATRGVLIMY